MFRAKEMLPRAMAILSLLCFQLCISPAIAVAQGRPASPDDARTIFQSGMASYRAGNLPDAAEKFQRACDLNGAAGCYNLGVMYNDGAGVPRDANRAFGLFTRACEGDYPSACNNLAVMYREGSSIPRNESYAASLYMRACNLGSGPIDLM